MPRPLPPGVRIRAFRDSDLNYLASTFLRSAHNLALFAGTPDRLYYSPMEKLFHKFVGHPSAVIAVVVDETDPDYIVAWMCAWILENVSVVWYAYVRTSHREKGICAHLIETLPGRDKASVFTSKIGHRIAQKLKLVRYPTLIFEVLT